MPRSLNQLTPANHPGWYLCDTEIRAGTKAQETVTRCYFWDGKELRGYEGGHFRCEMSQHRNFRGPGEFPE